MEQNHKKKYQLEKNKKRKRFKYATSKEYSLKTCWYSIPIYLDVDSRYVGNMASLFTSLKLTF